MKKQNEGKRDFVKKFNYIRDLITKGQDEVALRLLDSLYKDYSDVLEKEDKNILECTVILAQLNWRLGYMSEAKYYYSLAIQQIKVCKNIDNEFKIQFFILYARFLYTIKEYQAAISELEEQKTSLEVMCQQQSSVYLEIIDILASLYNIERDYQRTVEYSEQLLNILMKEHTQEFGETLTKENIKFEKAVLDKIISLHLDIGASLSRLGKFNEASRYLEIGYFISYTTYGDKDVKSLKLSYNIAVNEMQGINEKEGIRQLCFVYEDMKNYLGEDNEYTKKALDVLKMLDGMQGMIRGIDPIICK